MASKEAVIIPVYNEQNICIEIIDEVLRCFNGLVIVVNDGSIDDTKKLLKKKYSNSKRVVLINHKMNQGKGSAMRSGVEMAFRLNTERIVFLDADGQHLPKSLKLFFKKLEYSKIVFGYRDLYGKASGTRIFANYLFFLLIRIFFGQARRDVLCGYFGFNRDVYKNIRWNSDGYEVEAEISAKIARHGLKFSEIKIDTIYTNKKGGINVLDAIKILFKIPVWFLSI